jgi:DnaK suppressor protein
MLKTNNGTDTKTIERQRETLLAKLEEASGSMRLRDELIIESTADPIDYLQGMNQRDLAVDTLNRHSAIKSDIHLALESIDNGSYGICQDCGNHIPERRLNAIPWARYCVPCQEAREHEEQAGQHEWQDAA